MSENPYENYLENLRKTAGIMKLDENIVKILEKPQKTISVSIPVKMDDGTVKIFEGFRVQFNNSLGPYKGGIRFHQDVSMDEVKALSAWMVLKCAVVGIPLGGGKGGIIVNPAELSKSELERLSRGFIKKIFLDVGSDIDIPAPDVNTNAEIMGWMLDEYEKLTGKKDSGFITGKPIDKGGSEGRTEATAMGGKFVLLKFLEKKGITDFSGKKVAVQGFGNVGGIIAKLLYEAGFKVIALSDAEGGIYDENGLDVEEIFAKGSNSRAVSWYENAKKISNNELLELEADILVPAALENQITEKNADKIRAKIILELANGPTTPEADKILAEKGVIVIPDILANSGGVTVSYFEWLQNKKDEIWGLERVNSELKSIMDSAFEEVYKTSEEFNVDLRTSANIVALKKIASKAKNDLKL